MNQTKHRCAWAEGNDLLMRYHDEEWGVPLHDDQKLFEMLNLEGAQAGLSWLTILTRRDNYRKAFDNFDAKKIAAYDVAKRQSLQEDAGIIRNRLKIEAFIKNAQAFLNVQTEFGSFDTYVWNFVHGSPLSNTDRTEAVEVSKAMSKELKKRGFGFVGPTICFSFMQAVGMINDHTADCFCSANK